MYLDQRMHRPAQHLAPYALIEWLSFISIGPTICATTVAGWHSPRRHAYVPKHCPGWSTPATLIQGSRHDVRQENIEIHCNRLDVIHLFVKHDGHLRVSSWPCCTVEWHKIGIGLLSCQFCHDCCFFQCYFKLLLEVFFPDGQWRCSLSTSFHPWSQIA